MKRRSFFVRILNAVTAVVATSATGRTATTFTIIDPPVPLPMTDIEIPPWLRHWRSLSRQPVWESTNPTAAHLIQAAGHSQIVQLRYWGGSMPGEPRLFSPAMVFTVGQSNALYVNGWCHHRQAHRTLRLNQITVESPTFM